MKVTINGITYEGTEEEIRRIVADPPHGPGINLPIEFPDNDRNREIPVWPMRTYPWPDSVPHYPWPNSVPTNPNEWPHRNWDGTPIVTCSSMLNELGFWDN